MKKSTSVLLLLLFGLLVFGIYFNLVKIRLALEQKQSQPAPAQRVALTAQREQLEPQIREQVEKEELIEIIREEVRDDLSADSLARHENYNKATTFFEQAQTARSPEEALSSYESALKYANYAVIEDLNQKQKQEINTLIDAARQKTAELRQQIKYDQWVEEYKERAREYAKKGTFEKARDNDRLARDYWITAIEYYEKALEYAESPDERDNIELSIEALRSDIRDATIIIELR